MRPPLENLEFRKKYASVFEDGFSWENMMKRSAEATAMDWHLRSLARQEHIEQYGFAVLTEEAIEAILSLGPLLEVGAGGGYWGYELRKAGADIIITDQQPPVEGGQNRYDFQKPWTEIEAISALGAILKYPDRNLLTVWPDYDKDWTGEMLKAFKGQYVIYVGEGEGGCTADDAFHEELNTRFESEDYIKIPQFWGINDSIQVYKQKIATPVGVAAIRVSNTASVSGRKYRTEE